MTEFALSFVSIHILYRLSLKSNHSPFTFPLSKQLSSLSHFSLSFFSFPSSRSFPSIPLFPTFRRPSKFFDFAEISFNCGKIEKLRELAKGTVGKDEKGKGGEFARREKGPKAGRERGTSRETEVESGKSEACVRGKSIERLGRKKKRRTGKAERAATELLQRWRAGEALKKAS